MTGFLRNFHLERLSFWLGFLAASLLWWLLGRLRPVFAQLWAGAKARAQSARQELMAGTEIHLGNDTLRYAQSLHLAAPLFSLDEILIQPRLMAPLPPVRTETPHPVEDICDHVLPYLPDWPYLASLYHAPSLTLPEALAGGCNLVISGAPGSGKSVALAYLATLIIRKDPAVGDLADRLPLLVHAGDIYLPAPDPEEELSALISAVAVHASTLTLPRLPNLLQRAFSEGRALLLVDGLDEMPPATVDQIGAYLADLLRQYPGTRAVIAANEDYQDGLHGLNFYTLAMAAWNDDQRGAFIRLWGRRWRKYVHSPSPEAEEPVDPSILNGWLLFDSTILSPMELTLKVWATYAGDSLGPKPRDGIEAYLRRMTASIPAPRPALEQLALQTCLVMQPVVSRKEAESWSGPSSPPEQSIPLEGKSQPIEASLEPENGAPPPELQEEPTDEFEQEPDAQTQDEQQGPSTAKTETQKAPPTPHVLSLLSEAGLLVTRAGGRLSFIHPVIAGYLAACAMEQQVEEASSLLSQPEWMGRSLALSYLAASADFTPWLETSIADIQDDPTLQGLMQAARWLVEASEQNPGRSPLMRQLAAMLNSEHLAPVLRARCLSALVASNSANVTVLFRQLLGSKDPSIRQYAALGCGALRDLKAIKELTALLVDPSFNVRRAACLALVAMGDKYALETVAGALLHGDDDLRRFAAEALANHTEDGHPALVEGSAVDDLLVRRAVVFGLARINQEWAKDTLKKMQVEDSQWVVQNAATQALETMGLANPRLPQPLPPLEDTPWLIAFAGEKGIGVVPGKPAYDLLLLALKEGSEEQRLKAMNVLSRIGAEDAVIPLYQIFVAEQEDLQSQAYLTLRALRAHGIALPSPQKFGIKAF